MWPTGKTSTYPPKLNTNIQFHALLFLQFLVMFFFSLWIVGHFECIKKSLKCHITLYIQTALINGDPPTLYKDEGLSILGRSLWV